MNSSSTQPHQDPHSPEGTILIVDDDDKGRELTSLCLQSFGFRTLEVSNGREVIERWDEVSDGVTLILTDVVMPGGVSGFELGEWVQTKAPGMSVIFSSGFNRHPLSGKFRLREGENFISKPFSLESLVALIRRNLAGGRTV